LSAWDWTSHELTIEFKYVLSFRLSKGMLVHVITESNVSIH
jgi:hypothetical protein